MNSPIGKTILDTPKKWFYVAFVAINLFLSCYYLDVWITPNTASRAITVLTMCEDKSLVVDKYKDYAGDVSLVNGHYYANKAPFSSFLVYPFYAAYKSMGLHQMQDTTLKKYPIYAWEDAGIPDGRTFLLPKASTILIFGDILCGAIPFIITLLLSLLAMKRVGTSISPVMLVMLSFYASFLFAYAGVYTGHLLSGIFALGGYILAKEKKYIVSGLLVGLAVATEFPLGIVVPIWALLIYLNEKKISKPILFGLGLIPGFMLVLWYNYHLTGSITKTPYNYEIHQQKENSQDIGFGAPTLSALWGLVFSTYRGVLLYTPILLLMIWYAIKYNYQNIKKELKNLSAFISGAVKNFLFITTAAYLILYSAYYMWWGGWTFGPRYLIPMVLIVLYEGVIFLSKKRISSYFFYIITGAGLLITWLAKSTKIYMLPDFPKDYEKMNLSHDQLMMISKYKNPVWNIIIPDFAKHKFNTNTIPVFMFDSSPTAAIYAWPVLFILGMLVLSRWYSKLYPALVPIPTSGAKGIPVVKQKVVPKKIKRK